MNTTATIRELLLAGHSNKSIARQLNVRAERAQAVREELGLPAHKPGPTPAGSPEDAFWRRAVPTDDGHLLWPNPTRDLRTGHEGRKETAGRIAFRIRHRRDPVGKVLSDCGRPGCIHPDHVADRPMRTTFTAIFGTAA